MTEQELLAQYGQSIQQTTYDAVKGMSPQDAEVILRKSRQLGVDPGTYLSNPTLANSQIVPDWDNLRQRAPKTSSFLENPIYMAINQTPERVRQLSTLETYLNPLPAMAEGSKSMIRSTFNFFRGMGESGRETTQQMLWGNERTREDTMATVGQIQTDPRMGPGSEYAQMFDPSQGIKDKELKRVVQREWLQPVQVKAAPAAGWAGQLVQDLAGQAPMFAAQIALGMATGGLGALGPIAANTAFMGTQIAGSQYEKMEAEGVNPDRAFRAAVADAAMQAPMEAITLEGILSGRFVKWANTITGAQLGPKAVKMEHFLLGSLTESLTEWLQNYPEAATEIWARYPNATPQEHFEKFMTDFWDITKEGLYQGLVAAPYGAIGGALHYYGTRLTERRLAAEQARLDRLVEEVQRQDVTGRSPEMIQDFVNHVTGGEVVFAEPDAVARLFQSDSFLSWEEIDSLLGVSIEQIAEAQRTGEMLPIPLANYVTAAAQHPEIKVALKDHIAPESTEGMTQARIDERNQNDISAARKLDRQTRDDVRLESDRIAASIEAAGRGTAVNREAARRAATILEKHAYTQFYNGQAESPALWLRENAPQFIRDTAPKADALLQDGLVYKGSTHWKDGKAVVSLFEKADPSTLIHEVVGHYFGQNLIDAGARDTAPEWMRRDRQTLLDHVGVSDWTKATAEEKRAAHEKIARAAETYFMTGKAPSLETRAVFRRFREWLTGIYRDVTRLGANLTPEVRGVFDRMLASQTEIEELEKVEGYHARLPESVVGSLTPAMQEKYDRAVANARQEAEDILSGRMLDYLTASAKQDREKERLQAEQDSRVEADQRPFYKMTTQIETEYKAPAKTVAKRYQDTALPPDQEMHFDIVAEQNGYTSGAHLAADILEQPTREQHIKALTDARMKEWADIYLDKGALKEAAREALYSDDGRDLLAIEQQILEEKLGKILQAETARLEARQIAEQARVDAKDILSRRSLDDALKLQSYVASERGAAEKSARYLAKGKVEDALLWKRKQVLAHAMVQESLNIRREFDRINKFLNRQKNSDRKTWVTEEHWQQAADIMARFGYRRGDFKGEQTESLAAYVNRMTEENPDIIAIADWLSSNRDAKPTRKLTMQQLREVEGAVRNIKQMAKFGVNGDGLFVLEGDKISVTNEMIQTADRLPDVQEDEVGGNEKKNWLVHMIAGMRQPSTLFKKMDGADFGIWSKVLYYAMKDAKDYESRLMTRVTEALEQAYKNAGLTKADRYRDAHKKIYIKEWGKSVKKNALRAMLLNMGSESNLKRMLSEPAIGLDRNTGWTVEEIKNVLTKYLEPRDFRLAQDIWNAINLYDEYTATVRKVTGFPMTKVEPQPITFVVNGETIYLQGGYYPLKQDIRGNKQAELNAEKSLAGGGAGSMPYPNTGASKSRVQGAQYAVDYDLGNLMGSMSRTVHDIAFRPVAIDINKIMRQREVTDALRLKLGDEMYQTISKWQDTNLRGKESDVEYIASDGMLNTLRQRTVIANLLFRVSTIFQNAANFTLYGNAVEGFSEKDAYTSFLKYGVLDYIPNAFSQKGEDIRQMVYELSPMMKDKMDAPDYTLREMLQPQGNFLMGFNATREIGVQLAVTHDNMIHFGSKMLAFADQLTDVAMWRGAYFKAMGEGKTSAEAVRFADTVIQRTTGTGRTLDTNALQRGTPAHKLFTMFTTFVFNQYNKWAMEKDIQMNQFDALRLVSFAANKYIMFGLISAFASIKYPGDDDEWKKWFTKEVLEYPLSMIPIVGGGAKYLLDNWLGFKTFGYSLSPAERSIEQLLNTVSKVVKGKDGYGEELLTASAFIFGYPDQFNDWFMNAYDIMNGMEARPSDLIRRRAKKDR